MQQSSKRQFNIVITEAKGKTRYPSNESCISYTCWILKYCLRMFSGTLKIREEQIMCIFYKKSQQQYSARIEAHLPINFSQKEYRLWTLRLLQDVNQNTINGSCQEISHPN